MTVEQISRVGVVGCGTMGSGIAEIVARNGLDVHFVEVDDPAVEAGLRRINEALDRGVARDRLDAEQRDAIVARITGSTDFADLADADLVVEAVPEVLELKQKAFRDVDRHLKPDAILATNTSSLPVMDIAVHASRPNQVLGFHFFNPAPVMELIELVRTVVTDDSVVAAAKDFAQRIGKTPVAVGDRRGFIANQLLFPYLNQAVGMVETGYATPEDIDAAMRLGAGLPMGPIALVDLVGIDTMIGIMEAIHDQFGDTRFAPRPLLRQLDSAGFKGRKSGRGFYRYTEPGSSRREDPGHPGREVDVDRIASWRRVGVVGTGTMASGIAEVASAAGFETIVRGRSQGKAEAVIAEVARSLQRAVDKDRLSTSEMDAVVARLSATHDLRDLAGCDLVIEAVAEDLDVKVELLAELDGIVGPECLLTSTTSSLPVIELATASGRPERFVGLHFFNPASRMRLVEVVETVRTDADALADADAFVERLGKVGVSCPDRAGFIVNALLFPYLNDAVKMLSSHYATSEDVDTAMRLGCGYPMGPFELMDIVGLDVTLAIVDTLHAEFREPSYEPDGLLRHMVDAGFLGRKVGRGFHIYP